MNSKNLAIKLKALNVATAMLCMSFLFFYSCQEDDKNAGIAHDPSQPVTVTSFKPDSGRISEMVLLDGANFGTDTSNIRVYFNAKRAVAVNSTGTRILALVPRLPGDTCVVSVEVGDKKATYTEQFRYKIGATASNLTGDGSNSAEPVIGATLIQTRILPLYMGIDHDNNIFVTVSKSDDNNDYLLRLNVEEDKAEVVMRGLNISRLQSNVNADNVMLLGNEGAGNRDFFYTLDPKDRWVGKLRFIKKWIQNGYDLPSGGPSGAHANYETHHHCIYCPADGYYYTRYNGGQFVRINPKTWEGEIIWMTPSGTAYGMALHPIRKTEMWLAYAGPGDEGGALQNSICVFDVTDPASTFRKLSSDVLGGHRDGKLDVAEFQDVRQINFDPDGNLYIGESGNHCIRMIDTDNLMVETIIGIPGQPGNTNGAKDYAQFRNVHGLVSDSEGVIYLSDWGNHRVRRIAIE
jgi:hypothetical protein